MISILAWMIFKDALAAVIFLCLFNVATYYPTFRKSWHAPNSEPLSPYVLGAISNFFITLSVASESEKALFYPSFNFGLAVVFIVYLIWRRQMASIITAD